MTFEHTRRACYAGYVTQAIVNNLAPLTVFPLGVVVTAVAYASRGRARKRSS